MTDFDELVSYDYTKLYCNFKLIGIFKQFEATWLHELHMHSVHSSFFFRKPEPNICSVEATAN